MGKETADDYLRSMTELREEILRQLEDHGAAYTLIASGIVIISVSLVLSVVAMLRAPEATVFVASGSLLGLVGAAVAILDKQMSVKGMTSLQEQSERSLKETLDIIHSRIESMRDVQDQILDSLRRRV